MAYIYVSKQAIIGPDNGFSPGRRQAVIWAYDGIWLVRTFETYVSEIVSEIRS